MIVDEGELQPEGVVKEYLTTAADGKVIPRYGPLGVGAGKMNARDEFTVYESPVRFYENRIRAAAIYCSDGRFGEQVDDFLHNALKLPRYDRLAVPGGAACLAGHLFAYREEWGLVEHLHFLIRAHALERVVLIAHQDCAFYAEQLHVSSLPLETRQREDLQTAAERIRSFAPGLLVDVFFARKQSDGTIRFESFGRRHGRARLKTAHGVCPRQCSLADGTRRACEKMGSGSERPCRGDRGETDLPRGACPHFFTSPECACYLLCPMPLLQLRRWWFPGRSAKRIGNGLGIGQCCPDKGCSPS